METTLTSIEPIPVEYILGFAQTKATAAQRRPYIELVERWGDEMNCAVCPGVTIGDRCIIGAGSVVVKDIPSDSIAVGNPCRVIRKLHKK